jgi:hypothetical protein
MAGRGMVAIANHRPRSRLGPAKTTELSGMALESDQAPLLK